MREKAATGLVVLASLLLVAATIVGYARLAVFDSDRFADRAADSLQESSVRTVVGERVTDRLVLPTEPDLIAARPLIVSAVSGIVGGGAFASLFRRAVRDAHRAVFTRDQDTVTLTLVDVGTVAGAALEKLRPDVATKLESTGRIELLKRRIGGVTGDLARTADQVRILAAVLAVLTLIAAAAALYLTADRRRVAARLGVGMAGAGVLVLIAYAVARALALGTVSDPDGRAAAGAVWNAFLGDLRTTGWVLAGAGAVVAAAAESLIRPVAVEAPLRALWRIAATEPASPPLRFARAGALIAIGLLLIAHPQLALQVLATVVGVYALYKGVEAILRLVYRPRPEEPAEPEEAAPAPRPRSRLAAVVGIATLLIAGTVTAFVAGGGAAAPALPISRCNGHAELCERPLDEIAMAATHNSMSAPLPGWISAEQDRSIGGQLEDGIHGLLLDTHYGDRLSNGRVRTYFGSPAELKRSSRQDGVSPDSVAAALRLRARLGFRGEGTRGMYLCHSYCELGATPLADGLKDVHDFLATHPHEVVVMVNQDYVKPADFVQAMDDADLTPYAFTPPSGAKWPTLREMIEDGRRLVVLAENKAGAAPWYQLVYERLTVETPFAFGSAAALVAPAGLEAGCREHRGPPRAPLFLVNHWVTTAPIQRPSDAAKVNAYDALLRRARTCQRVRAHLPSLLAVNFYKEGDVFRVVDTLNRVGR